MSKRNQEVERIYIEQIRNVETAVYVLKHKKKKMKSEIIRLRTPYRKPDSPREPSIPGFNYFSLIGFVFFFAVFCFVLYKVFNFLCDLISSEFPCGVFAIGTFVITIFFLIRETIKDEKKYDEEMEVYEKELQKYKEKLERFACKEKENYKRSYELENNLNNYDAEINQVEDVRNNLYAINWIPLQYRNIRVVYYICDMVTTSEISIDEALKLYLMQEANNKLGEIIEKLDEIIDNQHQMIMNQAIIISQNKELISKNTKMINKLASIEDNTKLAADYAAIGVNYAEANAYISMATYLQK